MKKQNKKQLPTMYSVLIGVSIMMIVFRYLFLAEFGFEMDIITTAVPFFTAGILFAYSLGE